MWILCLLKANVLKSFFRSIKNIFNYITLINTTNNKFYNTKRIKANELSIHIYKKIFFEIYSMIFFWKKIRFILKYYLIFQYKPKLRYYELIKNWY